MNTIKEFSSLEDLAKLFEVSERTLLREIKAGRLVAFRVGKSFRVAKQAVLDYINLATVSPQDFDEQEEKVGHYG